MGAWDSGPFDNDSAADWCGDLDDAGPDERAGMVRQALLSAADSRDCLDASEGGEAMAAIAIVAAECCGGPPVTSVYAPDFLLEGGKIGLSDDLVPLALRALDRVLGEDSELWQLWEEADGGRSLLAEVEPLRAALGRGAAG
ncbi:DUF4259 domain-containing protein [Planomonospora sp. ID91781]|uniref:DUF4259 domain-containing protein n=1 Tax=Planomonospora sp. ID91781 TaxID=2738135 RepID=UPI0018C44A17|nr:DUF4259 domain-containing protein [Planomonospora sp. ID91781]MBG0825945.1 DUF4259 domain-containing protein [Planomonospora sp. ID91781]